MGTTYKQAGVDIEAGDALVERIKPFAARSRRAEVLSGVGGFGGMFALPTGYREPVLVSGTDGVGTKLKLAFELDVHDTVGIDLVAMSVNDVLTCGAEPLFFLDYFATSKVDVEKTAKVIAGVAEGCVQAGCTLLGGETAELPGFYAPGEYELAGFCTAVVEKSQIIDGTQIIPSDVVIGLASNGLHSNGFSLVRKIFEDASIKYGDRLDGFDRSLGQVLLTPTQIYVKDVLALKAVVPLKGLAHITGGGITGNLPRCLPKGLRAVLSEKTWKQAAIFSVLQQLGQVDRNEMFNTFNMGLGMCAVVAQSEVKAALAFLASRGVAAFEVGRICAGSSSGAEAEAIIEA